MNLERTGMNLEKNKEKKAMTTLQASIISSDMLEQYEKRIFRYFDSIGYEEIFDEQEISNLNGLTPIQSDEQLGFIDLNASQDLDDQLMSIDLNASQDWNE